MPTLTPLRPYLLRRAHLQVLVAAVDRAEHALGEPMVLAAAERFFGRCFASRDTLEEFLSDCGGHSQLHPWLLWDADLPGGPLGHRLLRPVAKGKRSPRKGFALKDPPGSRQPHHDLPLTGVAGEVLRALLETTPDVYQVVAAGTPSTVLERLSDGRQMAVAEPVLAAVAGPGDVFVARVVDCGDTALLDAVHACLPAATRRAMVRAARKAALVPLAQRLPLLLAASTRATDRLADAGAGWRDGEGLIRVTLVHAVEDPAALQVALRDAVAAGVIEQASPRRFIIVDEGFGPPGAVLRPAGERLYAATTSPARARLLRTAIERHLPGTRPCRTLYRDLDGLLDPRNREGLPLGEARAVAEDWVGECLATFHDTAHAWLGGVTPREAVRTVVGRNQLRAWLRTVEQVSELAGPRYRTAVQSIKRELAEG